MPLTVGTGLVPGESVVVQEVWRDRIGAARPMIVAQDDDELIAPRFPKGTIWKRPVPPPTHPPGRDRGERLARCLASGEWVFVDTVWDVSTLVLVRADVARLAERNEPPFSDPWPDWRPDSEWPMPELPAGWDELCR
jgi:hypothetical protein